MNRSCFWLMAAAAGIAALALPGPCAAGDDAWTPVSQARLDATRGGFVAPGGLVVAFGIERVAEVNGRIVAATTVSVADVGRMSAEEARALDALRGMTVVQAGQGTSSVPGGFGTLVIQNALDGQQIATRTTIDVSVGTLALFQDLNLAAALQQALAAAPPAP